MAYLHSGSYDNDAILDDIQNQAQFTSVALTAGSTFLAGHITGAPDWVVLNNTANTPGTMTTRTAAQMFADIQTQFNVTPRLPFAYVLRIMHVGTGTLTLAAGTGVTLAGTTTTVATATGRDYMVVFSSPTACTITSIGSVAT